MNQLEILLKLKNETAAGFAQLEKSVESVKKQTESLAVSQGNSAAAGLKFGAAVGVGIVAMQQFLPAISAVVGGVMDATKAFASAGSGLVDLKAKTGVGVVEMQKLQFAAKQSGVELGSLTTSLMQMEKAASKTPEKFAALGITLAQIRTSKPDELMALISDGLGHVSDQNERARIAMELFGKGGGEVLKMMTSDFRGLMKAAEETGLMTEEMAARGDRLDDALSKLDVVTKNLRINLAAAFASPGMIAIMEKMAAVIGFMAQNADKLAYGLMGAIPGLEAFVRAYAYFSPGADSGKVGGAPAIGKDYHSPGFDAGTKAFASADGAFAKLLRHMDDLNAKASKSAESSAVKAKAAAAKILDAWGDVWEEENKAAMRLASNLQGDMTGSMLYDPFVGIDAARGGAKYDNGDHGYVPNRSGLFTDQAAETAKKAAAAQAEAARTAARWAGALQGVALMAGAIGGKLGETIGAMQNIARSFEGWDKMGKEGKFNAVAGSVGQIGGLIGGTAGAGIQGAAGGAMAGFALGGPVGAAVGGTVGLIAGIFGSKAKQKQELADLKSQLTDLSDAAKHFGISLDSAFASKNSSVVKAAIDSVNNAIKESEKRLAGLSTAAGGLNAFAKGGGITDQASSDRAGMYAGAIFGGMVKETGDVIGALRAIGPALQDMAAKAKELGLSLGDGVANLLGMSGVLEANGGLADQISGLNQMMKGLGDAGMVTKDLFAAFGADASAVFAKLIEGGATGNQAMALMQPTLQQLYEGQKLHGYAVDEATQALLDQAKAEGIVGDQFMSANERMVELLGIIVETLGGKLPESYKRAGDAAEEYGRRATNSMPTYPNGGGANPGDSGDGTGPGFASGTAFRDFGRATQVTLHGEEAVMTRQQVDRLVGMAVAGSGGSGGSGPTGGSGQPIVVHLVVDGQVLASTFTNTMEGEGPEAQRFRQAYAGR